MTHDRYINSARVTSANKSFKGETYYIIHHYGKHYTVMTSL